MLPEGFSGIWTEERVSWWQAAMKRNSIKANTGPSQVFSKAPDSAVGAKHDVLSPQGN